MLKEQIGSEHGAGSKIVGRSPPDAIEKIAGDPRRKIGQGRDHIPGPGELQSVDRDGDVVSCEGDPARLAQRNRNDGGARSGRCRVRSVRKYALIAGAEGHCAGLNSSQTRKQKNRDDSNERFEAHWMVSVACFESPPKLAVS